MSDNPIFAISDRAAALRAASVDVVSLAAGEPDTPTPEHICDAAARAVKDPAMHRYGPAAGLPALRHTVAERLTATIGLPWAADDLLVSLGAKHALFLAMHAIVASPRSTVLVVTPGWPGHQAAVLAAGGQPRPVDTDATGFLATAETLERAWVPGTRAVVLANPANPTGATYDQEQWSEIAAWAARRDVWVITDDVYQAFVYDSDHVHALHAAPQLRERCIVIDSVSKAHSMTGWRVGWLAAPPPVVAAATTMLARTATHVPQITQAAAVEALIAGAADLRATKAIYRQRRDRAHHALNAVDGVDCPLPAGGMFLFPSVTALLQRNGDNISTTAELAAWLLDNAGVAVVPGEAFDAPGRLRLCFAIDDTALDKALDRLTDALNRLGR
ncbi:pyridoxal phosphate-dependent aminotransferase [Actinoplanes subglobosus]|uniref:Aminotransferase n=1 Tax=Actinoplanes subglobosus TaxID=1547892 RepID=A0ABV8IHU7_9ACTN